MPGILVVEDDENLNRGITFSLKKSGYEVFSAESVKKAKRIASDNNVDVTICDVNLPDGNGLEFVRWMRCNYNTYIICLTALDQEMDQVMGYEAGADDYITKPVSYTHLFRKWVNQIAKDYTIKGWVMDDERLKRGTYLTEKYFDEQLERIREIRASERKFYQKITDLYATAIDYDKNSATTRRFYATVQNKMHYAVHGHTAAELIVERADHTKEHMGLTTWADAPEGKIKKSDVTVAKNYLSQDEMKQLNRMVTAYLDFAESMTLRHIPLTMQDWEKRLNSFIEMFDYGILQDAGKVTAEIAKLHAETEFEKYRVIQDRLFLSDFDKYILELEESSKQ